MVTVIKSYSIDSCNKAPNEWGEFYNEMYKKVEDIKDCETLPQDIRRYIEDLKMEV